MEKASGASLFLLFWRNGRKVFVGVFWESSSITHSFLHQQHRETDWRLSRSGGGHRRFRGWLCGSVTWLDDFFKFLVTKIAVATFRDFFYIFGLLFTLTSNQRWKDNNNLHRCNTFHWMGQLLKELLGKRKVTLKRKIVRSRRSASKAQLPLI